MIPGSTLVDVLRATVDSRPHALAFRFLDPEGTGIEEWTYAEVDSRARAIAAHLAGTLPAGERALLLYPSGLEFVAAFLGCLYAGVVAVPLHPPAPGRPGRSAERLGLIAANCAPRAVLTTARLSESRDAIADASPALGDIPWIVTSAVPGTMASQWRPPRLGGDSVAFLQFTSGSTGTPKGVINRHAGILANEAAIANGFGTDESVHVVGWLPLFHDMGLIGNVLHPICMGGSCTLMAPATFLKHPLNWLTAISRYRGNVSGGPDFAYALCTARIGDAERETLDLSGWRVAYNGSEPVRAETMAQFAEAFAPCGFTRDQFLPCYGLAEATLYVTSSRGGYRDLLVSEAALAGNRGSPPAAREPARALVSSGLVAPGHSVLIVDPDTGLDCPDTQVGEVWASGPSIAAGYWNDPDRTAQTFVERATPQGTLRFLRTGDLGFVAEDELFVTGRLKDLIILRGRNLYPHDIEATAARADPQLRAIGAAAFPFERAGEERLGIVVEVPRRLPAEDRARVIEAVRTAIARDHDAWVDVVVLTQPNAIPKTSSGKIRRRATREQWLTGELSVIETAISGASDVRAADDMAASEQLDLTAIDRTAACALVRDLLMREIAAIRGGGTIAADAGLARLGLDSLMTLELQARIERRLGVQLPGDLLMPAPTIDALADAIAQGAQAPAEAALPRPLSAVRAADGQVSSGQWRLFVLEGLAQGLPVYHVQAGVRIDGALDALALEAAFRTVEERHPILRTGFVEQDGVPRRRFDPAIRNRFRVETIESDPARLDALRHEEAWAPFDLAGGRLTRILLCSIGPDAHMLVITQHHLITDGWSIKRLIGDLARVHAARIAGDPLPPAPAFDFGDFVDHEASADSVEDRAFWERQLRDLDQLALPGAVAPIADRYRGGRIDFTIPPAAVRRLSQIARDADTTLFTVLLTAYALLLRDYGGRDRFAIGGVVANRRPQFHDLLGFFANTVVLRCDLSGARAFGPQLARMEAMRRETLRHAAFPFAEAARLAHASGGDHPAFQAAFVFESGVPRAIDAAGAQWIPSAWSPDGAIDGTAKFDLSLAMVEMPHGIAGGFEYNAARFDEATARRFAASFEHIVAALAAAHAPAEIELDPLTPTDRIFLAETNATCAPFPDEQGFAALFEAQARRTPDRRAIRDGVADWTYARLDAGGDGVACGLATHGAGPETLVALLAPRGCMLAAAMLGTFKAGAAYVPIDPHYPTERQRQIAEQSGARLLLTTRALLSEAREIAGADTAVLAIEDLIMSGGRPAAPAPVSPRNIAYVIYTSGSTGTPKGAAVEHRGMINHLYAKIEAMALGEADVVAQTASQCFDISVWQTLAALAVGGSVEVIDTEIAAQPEALFAHAAASGVTVLEIVPSLLRAACDLLAHNRADAYATGALRWLLLTGEALPAELVRRWLDRHAVPVINAYGPTECSDDVTHGVLRDPAALTGAQAPIGRPIINTQLHILDRGGRLAPIGAVGDLHVGGTGVGRGYWRDPARTAAAFLPDPFAPIPGARMYRTGDRARILPDGELLFLGRDDDQVKIRGFRIELGEVEAAIERHEAVAAAAVVAYRADGEQRLVAYVVGAVGAMSEASLRRHLAGLLPDYMLPAGYVFLESLPLTPNGKLDRRALPDPADAIGRGGAAYVAPAGPIEELVAQVWGEVLGIARIGAADHFFERGGHSLLATRVVARLRSVLGVELPLRALFEAPSVAAFARAVEQARGDASTVPPLQPRADRDAPAALSFAQHRLWFLEQLAPGEATYNVAGAFRVTGALDIDLLERSLSDLVARHETLRTRFGVAAGEPLQLIAPDATIAIARIDLAGTDSEARAQAWLAAEARRPFDLEHGPLLRAAVLRLGDDAHILSVSMHHIVSDGWSLGVLMRELSELYAAHLEARTPALEPLAVQYADYSAWQHDWLQGEVLDAQIAYWRDALEGVPTMLDLPLDRPRAARQRQRGAQHRLRIDPALAERLRGFARGEGATLYMLLLAGFQALLSRYTGQQRLLVGSPIAGRTQRETEGLIGFFVNTLVLRGDLGGDPGLAALLARVRETTLSAFAHQDVPFEKLVEALAPQRDLSRSPLFQAMFILQNAPAGELALGDARLEPVAIDNGTAKFDLTLALEEGGDGGIEGYCEYDRDLFDRETIARFADHYVRLLSRALDDPAMPIARIDFLSDAERRRLLHDWNDTKAAYPDKTLHQLFEEQAAATPEATALIHHGATTSYAALDAHANRIAHVLRQRGVGPGHRVGIAMHRSPALVAALLATLKTGAAYVPLDPDYPAARLGYMTRSASITIILTDARSYQCFDAQAQWIDVDGRLVADQPDSTLPPRGSPGDPAYIVFTSGSTGTPNGVIGLHRGAINRCNWMWRRFPFAAHEVSALKTSTNFVDSIWELFGPLLKGIPSVIFDRDDVIDIARFVQALGAARVTRIVLVPSLLRAMLDADPDLAVRLPALDYWTVSGEALDPSLVAAFEQHLPGKRLLNLYGCSEASGDSTALTEVVAEASVPIGHPIDNTRIYILDRALRPVAPGLPGEVYIAGDGLNGGYLAQPARTAERFVPDPFAARRGERLYRTRDIGRHRPDGAIEYLGRIDRQVKIRGVRIDLGEVEAALASHPDVQQVVVTATPEALVAYVVGAGGGVSEASLRRHLAGLLPDYMLPAGYVFLESLPLTPNGKLDRRALPDPGDAIGRGGAVYVAPAGPIEELVAQVWGEVLGIARIGAADHFFERGGHSLLATRVVARLRSVLGVELPLRALFEAPSVAAFARAVEQARGEASTVPPLQPRADRDAPAALSFAQHRLWFLEQLAPGEATYNVAGAMRVTGALDIDLLERSLSNLVARHETLRTRFGVSAGEPLQLIAPEATIAIARIDLAGTDAEARAQAWLAAEARRPFDLERGPLLRAAVLRLGDDAHILSVSMHHIVSDGWSLGVLMRELSELYAAHLEARTPALEPLAVQYADYSAWQHDWLQGEVLDAQIAYWRDALEGVPTMLDLPLDRPRAARQRQRGAQHRLRIDPALAERLRGFARGEGATLYMLLLAGFQALLSRYTGQQRLLVGSPIAGRTQRETEGLIGFFVNTLVLRGDLGGDPGLAALLAQVRETTLSAFAHQDVPFEKLVEALAPQRDLSRSPLFQAMFILQNAPAGELALGDARLEPVAIDNGTAKFDLTLALEEGGDGGIEGYCEYDRDLFDRETIARFADHYVRLLSRALDDPAMPIARIDFLSDAERHRLLHDWNDTKAAYPDKTLHQLFEEQAAATPEATALIHHGATTSYAALDAHANRIAHALRQRGVGPGHRVGIAMHRSPALVAALLATLKTGAAYVPLDPDYPAARLGFMLDDADAMLALVSPDVEDRIPPSLATMGIGDDLDCPMVAQDAPFPPTPPDAPAYVLHTSGSTGRPKGVMVPHRGVSNCIAWMQQRYRLGADDRFLFKTSLNFDPSVWELFWPLAMGAAVVIAPRDAQADPEQIVELVERDGVTTAYFVPAMLEAFLDAGGARAGNLRHVICGGEKLPQATIDRFLAESTAELHHSYGPTEASIAASEWTCIPDYRAVVVGRPLGNVRLYLLGRCGELVPPGVAGELHIGGGGVATGYAGRAGLTAERFVPDRFGGAPGARLYRSGDMMRYLPDGNLEFLGRRDDQIKLRGHRVELGEIERVIEEHGAREAVMAIHDRGGAPLLVAYITVRDGTALEPIRSAVRRQLPAYMIPSDYVVLADLPRGPNGKVDRTALRAPDARDRAVHVAPVNATEREIAAIWAELLGRERVGRHDDFFQLGGHSLLAVRILARLNERFAAGLQLHELFELRMVAELAEAIKARPRVAAPAPIPRAERRPVRVRAMTAEFADGARDE
ncbi:non-ribosomal peptide synthetase [Sphingomonas qomolangmaensis]|uniref:Amino acid adenylation domain-containing protein n=1 Tax=Sphingomonas qomolangmaensis TaxID=2918765 RepID=A0ABY5L784_9SPHN|nr:non-ribosomal peptide synthetase [Sphingomonas qomolangmaensis]UUL82312.1 amino acid adenylation domain-containing protein [Sphingomonas qomolangmaensis]